MRGVTWVRIQEFEGGDWAIGGKALEAAGQPRPRLGKGGLSRRRGWSGS